MNDLGQRHPYRSVHTVVFDFGPRLVIEGVLLVEVGAVVEVGASMHFSRLSRAVTASDLFTEVGCVVLR